MVLIKRTRLAAGAVLAAVSVLGSAVVSEAGPSPGGYSSENVEWIDYVPFQNDTAGGRLVGDYFYVTTSRGLTIYDVSDPLKPKQTGFLLLPQDPYFSEEDPDTNGKVLLVGATGFLNVINVEDKSNPTVISRLQGADSHTISCVLDCTWAYASGGFTVNLTNPRKPKLAGEWSKGLPAKSGHDVTEISPGIVLTATQPIMLLDARRDPRNPKLLATGANEDKRFIHGVAWPKRGRDRFFLAGGETGGPTCDGDTDGALMTWETRDWRRSHTFRMVDEYRVSQGLATEGRSPADLFCAHWFETHPQYEKNGLLAMAWYEHGTKFFRISQQGRIEEVGYFVPFAGSTSAPYWLSNEIVYAVDYNRGIDILRYGDD
jgi:hypothetical protein